LRRTRLRTASRRLGARSKSEIACFRQLSDKIRGWQIVLQSSNWMNRSLSIDPATDPDVPAKPTAKLLPLWVYLGFSAALSWTVWLLPKSHQGFYVSIQGWRVTWPLDNLRLMIGNCLPGLLALIWASVEGKHQLRDVLSSLVSWRVQPKWYVLAIAFPCGLFVVSSCLVITFYDTKLSWPSALAILNSLVAIPFGPLWEELAWRAFALRKLQCRYSRLLSALIIGVYWAVWHIPLWVVTLNYLTSALLLIICINLVCWSVIFSFLYERSGQSLPVVIVLHATYLTVQNLAFASVSSGTLHVIPIAAALSVCLAVIVANEWTSMSGVRSRA
jgi:membrane protease YdiL (CAAX protease family)